MATQVPILGANPNTSSYSSDINDCNRNREILFLRPEDMVLLPQHDVRPFKDIDNEAEAQKIEKMALSLESIGQQDDCIAVPWKMDGKEVFALIAGNRRRRAMALLNQKLSGNGKPLMRLRVAIDRSGKDLIKKAWQTNGIREMPNTMDLAAICVRLCEEHGWDKAFKGWKKCAEYLNVDPATITQAIRIYNSNDPELMRQVASGRITATAAFDLLTEGDVEVRKDALKRAEEIELERSPDKAREVKRPDGTVDVEATRIKGDAVRKGLREAQANRPVQPPVRREKWEEVEKSTLASAPAASAPAASAPVKPTRALPWNRKEIVEYFEAKDGPMYGHIDSAVRVWLNYLTTRLFRGEGNVAEADKLFAAAVKGSDPGKGLLSTIPAGPTKTATGRQKRTDAKGPATKKAAKKVPAKKAPPKPAKKAASRPPKKK